MNGRRWLVCAACFLVSALGASAVRAGGGGTVEGGTISFVGAIVEPTCSLTTMPALSATPAIPFHQADCGGPPATGAAAAQSRPHDIAVEHLSSSDPDRVLRYFVNYVRAAQAGSADPVLVTQAYE